MKQAIKIIISVCIISLISISAHAAKNILDVNFNGQIDKKKYRKVSETKDSIIYSKKDVKVFDSAEITTDKAGLFSQWYL